MIMYLKEGYIPIQHAERSRTYSDVLGPIIVSMLFCSLLIGPPSVFRLECFEMQEAEEQETKLSTLHIYENTHDKK